MSLQDCALERTTHVLFFQQHSRKTSCSDDAEVRMMAIGASSSKMLARLAATQGQVGLDLVWSVIPWATHNLTKTSICRTRIRSRVDSE